MRTKLSELFHSGMLGALVERSGRPESEEYLEIAQRAGGSRVQASANIAPPEKPEDVGGKGSGTTDYAEGQAVQEDKEAGRE